MPTALLYIPYNHTHSVEQNPVSFLCSADSFPTLLRCQFALSLEVTIGENLQEKEEMKQTF